LALVKWYYSPQDILDTAPTDEVKRYVQMMLNVLEAEHLTRYITTMAEQEFCLSNQTDVVDAATLECEFNQMDQKCAFMTISDIFFDRFYRCHDYT
jgi:hypothetical protein